MESQGIAKRDVAQLSLIMLLWALCFPLISLGLAYASPLVLAALRSVVAGLGLLIVGKLTRRSMPRGWRLWLSLFGVGIGTTSIGFGGMFLAGGLISPGIATVLSNTQPLISAVIGFFVLGEILGPRRRVGLVLGFAGVLLISAFSSNNDSSSISLLGVSYVFLGALGVAIGNILMKKLAGQVDVIVATGLQFLLGAIPLFILAQFFEGAENTIWNFSFVILLLALALFGTALVYILWFSLLSKIELNRLNTYTFLTPVITLIIGFIFFDEQLIWIEWAGIVVIFAGVYWISRTPILQSR